MTNFSEWRPGNKGGLILRDEDSRSRLDGEYRVVNTLALYNVSCGKFCYEVVFLYL